MTMTIDDPATAYLTLADMLGVDAKKLQAEYERIHKLLTQNVPCSAEVVGALMFMAVSTAALNGMPTEMVLRLVTLIYDPHGLRAITTLDAIAAMQTEEPS